MGNLKAKAGVSLVFPPERTQRGVYGSTSQIGSIGFRPIVKHSTKVSSKLVAVDKYKDSCKRLRNLNIKPTVEALESQLNMKVYMIDANVHSQEYQYLEDDTIATAHFVAFTVLLIDDDSGEAPSIDIKDMYEDFFGINGQAVRFFSTHVVGGERPELEIPEDILDMKLSD